MILTYLGNPKDLTNKEIKELLNSNINNKGSLIIELLNRSKSDIKAYFRVKDKISEIKEIKPKGNKVRNTLEGYFGKRLTDNMFE